MAFLGCCRTEKRINRLRCWHVPRRRKKKNNNKKKPAALENKNVQAIKELHLSTWQQTKASCQVRQKEIFIQDFQVCRTIRGRKEKLLSLRRRTNPRLLPPKKGSRLLSKQRFPSWTRSFPLPSFNTFRKRAVFHFYLLLINSKPQKKWLDLIGFHLSLRGNKN